VALEGETFELWCPHHADTDNSDEDYNFQQAARPRRQTGELAEAQGAGNCWQFVKGCGRAAPVLHLPSTSSVAPPGVLDLPAQSSCPSPAGGVSASGKRQRASSDAQRPRTDWQKKDEHTWLKVVPPWWCEHRTVHFASE
jgi:hypothetical protein